MFKSITHTQRHTPVHIHIHIYIYIYIYICVGLLGTENSRRKNSQWFSIWKERMGARFIFHIPSYLSKLLEFFLPWIVKCVLSHVRLSATPWTVVHQTPLSIGFYRQYWSGLPFPSPGDLPNPWIKPTSLVSPALADGFLTTSATWEAQNN